VRVQISIAFLSFDGKSVHKAENMSFTKGKTAYSLKSFGSVPLGNSGAYFVVLDTKISHLSVALFQSNPFSRASSQ
jgi:hypothetical protein